MSQQNSNLGMLAVAALLGSKPEISEVWYNKKRLKLDGFRFNACRFDKCRLEVTSTNFELINCYIDDETVISFSSELIKVIKLFHCRSKWPTFLNFPGFTPIKNTDGTITIKSDK